MRGVRLVLRRGIAARRARIAAVGLAIAAAVAFLAGTYVLTDTINASVQNSAIQASGNASAVVTSAGGAGGSLLGGAPTLSAKLATQVRGVRGVSVADGVTIGYAMPLNSRGHAIASTSLGISVPSSAKLRMLTLRSGQWPNSAGQVVVDATTAGKLGLASGSTVRIALPGGVRSFQVSGVAGFGSAQSLAGISIVGFTPSAATSLLGTGGKYAAIEVAGAPGVSATRLADRIRKAIGSGYTVRTSTQQADHLVSTIASYTSAIGTVLTALAVIALLVAALLIANTFAITVAQRTRELALLRCIGASRRQAAWLVLWEAAAVGLFGGIVGLLGGIGLAVVLRDMLGAVGLPIPAAAPEIRSRTVVASLAVGVGVTVGAASFAAFRASRSRPLSALAGSEETVPAAGSPSRVRLGCAIGAGILGALLLVLAGKLPMVALGVLLLLIGTGLAGPMLVRPLTAPARAVQSAIVGVSARLAGRQMLRNPRRVVGTAGTLAIAVATVTVVSAVAATSTSSRALGVSRSLRADYVVTAPLRAGVSPSLTSRIGQLTYVTGVTGMPCGAYSPPGGGSETACGIDPARYGSFVNLGVTSGALSNLSSGSVAVASVTARRNRWHVGQKITVSYPVGGSQEVRIAAIYTYDQVAGDFLMPMADYVREFPSSQQAYQTVLISVAPGAQQKVRGELAGVLRDYPQTTLNDKARYSSQVNSGINLVATLMTGLLALSLLIGLMGVATALTLSVLERTREIGILRAVGAEARQVRAIVRAEALTSVVTGALAGLILGLAIGWPLALALRSGILGPPGVPALLLAVAIPGSIIAGLLAAMLPAHRAARLNILTALYVQ